MSTSSPDFFTRYEFLIRRLHSLTGLVPVGAYMTVHLLVNASILNGPAAFQGNVNGIHALGPALPLIEWSFIFLPIIFHALIGVWIIRTGKSNTSQYRYVNNWRYSLQRVSGMIAIVFIFFHVFHLHGWFHTDWWLSKVQPWGMAQFRPYNAASTLAGAFSGFLWPVFYVIGIVASVFHFANGVWTMGITWGVWTSPRAQRDASYVCAAGGIGLLLVGLSALLGVKNVDAQEAKAIEDAMYKARIEAREIEPTPHKTTDGHAAHHATGPQEDGDSASGIPHSPPSESFGEKPVDRAANAQYPPANSAAGAAVDSDGR